ncbi:MAG: FecR domain-containing protein [Proteobacteria bacterium]|nr:FecR domain-containing protein [Pseudomonadota bacterium]
MKKALFFTLYIFVAMMLCLFMCLPAVASSDNDYVELRVEKGDKLINICNKYLSNPAKWREVAKFNRMENPDFILPGQRIKIPARLIQGVPLDGRTTFIYGDVKIQKNEISEWAKLRIGDSVSRGSRIQTGKASSAEITFEDKNSIFIKSDTTLGIITSEKKGSNYTVNNFYLKTGRVVTKIKEATGSDSRITINTPSAAAAVRGTEFRVSVDQAESMRTEVLTGIVGVTAMKKTIKLKEGEGTYVQKGSAPTQPAKLLPPPELLDHRSIYKDMPLKFTFKEMPGLLSIRGLITKDREGRNIMDEKIIRQKESLEFINLLDDTYYLFCQGIDELGIEGFQSRPYEIKLKANPLPPLIHLKGDEAEFIGKSAEFKWLKVKDAAKYHVQVASERNFAAIMEEKTDHSSETYKTGALDFNQYYLRVSSIADDGYEAGWSEIVPFRLVPPPPSPQLDKPTVSEKNIFLKWKNLGESITYHFQIARDMEFKEVILDKKIEKSEISFEKPEDSGEYYVRTSSIDRKGREGDFSSPQSFEIKSKIIYGLMAFFTAVGITLLLVP